jgi:hypothetical protein
MRRLVLLFVSTLCLLAESFSPAEVKILGDIDYGQTSAPLECGAKPSYCALVFNGRNGDQVDVTVKGDRRALVSLADGSLKELIRGTDHVTYTLSHAEGELVTYYIVFRDVEGKAGRFTVELKKVEKRAAR